MHCFAPEIANRFYRALSERDSPAIDALLTGFAGADRGRRPRHPPAAEQRGARPAGGQVKVTGYSYPWDVLESP
ncbi:MAG TPA: hypothetical protein VGP05_09505, partial [Pseudonocardia sp.]|nr:hypothetical protein [Pseudonocardia sp.]